MNAKKIFKGVIGLGTVVSVAYAAYKLGECNGESKERIRQKFDDDYDGDYYIPSDYDEPDDGCIKPSCRRGERE